jgi:GntR family transcriptional regulator
MLDITVRAYSDIPIYRQLAFQLKKLIADACIKPGECLPPVRTLAAQLKIAPPTVSRAYAELIQEGIVGASRRRGTIVLGDTDSPQRSAVRAKQLEEMVDKLIIDGLSLGYSPDEIESSFRSSLADHRG